MKRKLRGEILYIVWILLLTAIFVVGYPQAVKDGELFFWICNYFVWLGVPLFFKNE